MSATIVSHDEMRLRRMARAAGRRPSATPYRVGDRVRIDGRHDGTIAARRDDPAGGGALYWITGDDGARHLRSAGALERIES